MHISSNIQLHSFLPGRGGPAHPFRLAFSSPRTKCLRGVRRRPVPQGLVDTAWVVICLVVVATPNPLDQRYDVLTTKPSPGYTGIASRSKPEQSNQASQVAPPRLAPACNHPHSPQPPSASLSCEPPVFLLLASRPDLSSPLRPSPFYTSKHPQTGCSQPSQPLSQGSGCRARQAQTKARRPS